MKRYDVQVELIQPRCPVVWEAARIYSRDGEHIDAEEALAEIAKRDKRIAELEAELARLHAADSSCPYCGEAYE